MNEKGRGGEERRGGKRRERRKNLHHGVITLHHSEHVGYTNKPF